MSRLGAWAAQHVPTRAWAAAPVCAAFGYAVALAGFAWFNQLKGQEIAGGTGAGAPSKAAAGDKEQGHVDGGGSGLAAAAHVNGHGPAAKPIVMDSAGSLTQPLLTFNTKAASSHDA